jgi:hypothetical protein
VAVEVNRGEKMSVAPCGCSGEGARAPVQGACPKHKRQNANALNANEGQCCHQPSLRFSLKRSCLLSLRSAGVPASPRCVMCALSSGDVCIAPVPFQTSLLHGLRQRYTRLPDPVALVSCPLSLRSIDALPLRVAFVQSLGFPWSFALATVGRSHA